MKKFAGFYLLASIVYAALLMQQTAEQYGGYVGVTDYWTSLVFLFKGLLWPLALLRWLF